MIALRILFVSPYPPSRDGIGDYTKSLANAIQKAGNEVRVVTPYEVLDAPSEVIGSLSPRGQSSSKLRNEISHWRPDIVHVQFAIAAFGTRTITLIRWLTEIRRDLDAPIVATMHELNREHAILGPIGYSIHRSIIKRCDHLILHSAKVCARRYSKIAANEPYVTVMPHPTAPRRISTSSEPEIRSRFGLGTSRILLAFGFIHIDKGLEDLISALQIIQKRTPSMLNDLRLVIAGDIRPRRGLFRVFEVRDYIYRAQLVRQIRRSNLQNSIIMTGYVPYDEVAAWFNLAEAVVLPYRRTAQSGVESLARSFNLPVLASEVIESLDEFAPKARWTFPPREPSGIAEAITEFLTASPSKEGGYDNGNDFRNTDTADLLIVSTKTINFYTEMLSDVKKGNVRVTHA